MYNINKYASIMYRISQAYFDDTLTNYHIGSGQQFFLMRIHDMPGISQLEIAEMGHYDKGTTARAVKKLEDEGYVYRIIDEHDRRISKLYVTPSGEELVMVIVTMLHDWYDFLTLEFDDEEKIVVEKLMSRIADNAQKYCKQSRKKVDGLWNKQ